MDQSSRLLNRYDVDMQAVLEPGINWAQFKSSETLASFFDAEVELQSVTGHNKHETGDMPACKVDMPAWKFKIHHFQFRNEKKSNFE